MGDADAASLGRLTAHLRNTATSTSSSSSPSTKKDISLSHSHSHSHSSRPHIRTTSHHSQPQPIITGVTSTEWTPGPAPLLPPIVPPKDLSYHPRRPIPDLQDPSASSPGPLSHSSSNASTTLSTSSSSQGQGPSRHSSSHSGMKRKVISRSGSSSTGTSSDPRPRGLNLNPPPSQAQLQLQSKVQDPTPTPLSPESDDVVLMTAFSLANYSTHSSTGASASASASTSSFSQMPENRTGIRGAEQRMSTKPGRVTMVHDRTSVLACEVEVLKREIEKLKERDNENKRAIKKHTKKIEELKTELQTASSAIQAKDSELATVKKKSGQQEELITTIENTIQCQICMELPLRPYAISPCGHILCLTCLQEWFKKAPPALDDMDVIDPDELTDPSYILRRSKTCPTCRAAVRRKPAPVFMVKGVVGALVKYRAGPSGGNAGGGGGSGVFPMALLGISLPAPAPEPDASEDPWEGIFERSSSSDEGEMDEDDDDLDDDGTEYGSSAGSEFGMFYDHDDIDVGDHERWGYVDSEDEEGEERWHEGNDGEGSDDEHEHEHEGLNVRGEGERGQFDDHLNLDHDHDEEDEEPQIQRARPARSLFPFGSTASPSPPPPASLTLSMPLHLPLAISVPMPMPIIQQNQYVLPRWEPPNIELLHSAEMMRMLRETMGGAGSGDNYNGSGSGSDSPEIMMKLLRRGCTLGMLQSFEVTYTHTDGIIVFLRSLDHLYASDSDRDDGASDDGSGAEQLHRVFLGWNVYIDEDDEDGEEFMVGMLEDMKRCGYRWRIEPRASEAGARLGGGAGSMGARRPSGTGTGVGGGGRRAGGAMDARRLVSRDDVWDYESEDSESWVVGGGRRY